MAVRAIAADKEQILNTETYVSSNLAFNVSVYLPDINAGGGSSVAVDTAIRIETLAAGAIEVLAKNGARVGIIGPRNQAIVIARTGAAQSESDGWNFREATQTPSPLATISAAYSQAEVTALRTCLVNNGLMKAE